jgi:hypothetical protein
MSAVCALFVTVWMACLAVYPGQSAAGFTGVWRVQSIATSRSDVSSGNFEAYPLRKTILLVIDHKESEVTIERRDPEKGTVRTTYVLTGRDVPESSARLSGMRRSALKGSVLSSDTELTRNGPQGSYLRRGHEEWRLDFDGTTLTMDASMSANGLTFRERLVARRQ